jgi:hypothetical protein
MWGSFLLRNVVVCLTEFMVSNFKDRNLDNHRRDNLMNHGERMFSTLQLHITFYLKISHEWFVLAP